MTNTKEILGQEYEGLLEKMNILDYKDNTYGIRDMHIQLMYIESIPNQAVAGSAFIADTIDLPTLLPMIGEEKLEVSFTRAQPGTEANKYLGGKLPSIKFKYPIFRMEGKLPQGGSRKKQSYTLHYCSELPFQNLNNVVYKSFKNMKYSDMVKKIYDSYLKSDQNPKPLIVEETKNYGDLHLSGMSPLAAIRKIAKRSISKEGNGFLYVFYEDRDAYHFVTLHKMMKQDPQVTVNCQLKNVSKSSSGLSDRDLETQLYNTDNYTRENTFNVLSSAMMGEGTSSLFTIDPLIRKYYYNEFDLKGKDNTGEEYWKKVPHLGDKKPWTTKNKMFIKPLRNLTYTITDLESGTDDYFSSRSYEQPSNVPEDYYLHRQSLINQLDKNTVTVTITGDPRIKVGCVVQFDVPEMLGGSKETSKKDAWVQGKYLVLAAGHHFTNDEYKITMKLIRDGFHTDIYSRDPQDHM